MKYERHDGLSVELPAKITDTERDKARATVERHCPDDAALMLDMLGLAA